MVVGAFVLGATMMLSACGTGSSSPAVVSGVPATSISVGLSQIACTPQSVCVAAGTSSTGVGPVATAEFMTPDGHWYPLVTPTSTMPQLSGASCVATSCLLVGSAGRADLLWRFDAQTHLLGLSSAPPGGSGVWALSCDGVDNCALIDDGANGVPRFSYSADGGGTWSTPLAMDWAKGFAVTSLRCGAPLHCLASVTTPTHALLQSTFDGGLTWTSVSGVSTSWTTLHLSWCHFSHCVALATGTSDYVVRTSNDGVTWTSDALNARVNALSCRSTRHCVAVGATSSGSAWLATLTGSTLSAVHLRYVPTPLLAVACGTTRCGALGVTTLVSVPTS